MRKRKIPFQSRFRCDLFDVRKAIDPKRSTPALELILNQQLDRQSMFDNFMPRDEIWEVALSLWGPDRETAWLFSELQLDPNNPFHWRALLEAFTKTYVTETKDRSIPRASVRLRLAVHVNEIRQKIFGGKWRPTLVVRHLREQPPYRKRWSTVDEEALRKWVRKLQQQVGPMDDLMLDRAREAYQPDNWINEIPERWRHLSGVPDDDD